MTKNKLIFLLTLLLLFTYFTTCQGIDLSSELVTEYNYQHFDDLPLPSNLVNNSAIKASISGVYKDYQYNLGLKGTATNYKLELTEVSLNRLLSTTVFEIGRKEWVWGKGFSYSPTYTLDDKSKYWGVETNTIFNNSTLTWGSVLNENNKGLYSSWLRYNSLLTTSDYTFVLAYLDKQSNKENINLGVNYSKDFLNGLAVHSGANLSYEILDQEINFQHLLGLDYITKNNRMILLEFYRKQDNKLTLAINNYSSSFNNWNWQIKETINLNDLGQLRTLTLSYSGKEDITPELEVSNFGGADNSKLEQNPKDLVISLKVTIDIK